MPPNKRVLKEEIVSAALELVRKNGEEAINARAIASFLNCSTQPIFSNFATMSELRKLVLTKAYDIYIDFLKTEVANGEYPQYKSFGMAYIRFARQERELFKLLFMTQRNSEESIPTFDFDASVEMIMNANGISKELAQRMHFEMWTCVHGIATMIATSFLSLEREFISAVLTDVYQGLRTRYLSEGI